MPTNITIPSVTYSAKDSKELFFKPVFNDPDLKAAFNVRTDIQNQEKVYMVGSLSKITKKYQSCSNSETARTNDTRSIPITEKTITTVPLEVNLELCADVFTATFLDQVRKSGLDVNDLTGTQIEEITLQIVRQAMAEDFFRIISFGDTSSVDAHYQQLNGLWRTVFNNINSYCISTRKTIGSGSLGTDAAHDKLWELYQDAPNVLKQLPESDRVYYVTGSIYDNLLRTYSKLGQTEAQFTNLVNGQKRMLFNGIPVIPMRSWDTWISADLGNFAPHRIVYTTPKNHIIGIEADSDFNEVRTWYQPKEDMNYIRAKYRAGYQFMHCDYIAVAY
jgi:hypothetical protein